MCGLGPISLNIIQGDEAWLGGTYLPIRDSDLERKATNLEVREAILDVGHLINLLCFRIHQGVC